MATKKPTKAKAKTTKTRSKVSKKAAPRAARKGELEAWIPLRTPTRKGTGTIDSF